MMKWRRKGKKEGKEKWEEKKKAGWEEGRE
jgi:hypothetical protein